MKSVRKQLELLGFEGAMRAADAEWSAPADRARARRRVEATHTIASSPPESEDISYLHSGLCQTCLPHRRPASNRDVWKRQSGRFRLIVQPGYLDESIDLSWRRADEQNEQERAWVGVPYGPKARLILIYLQTEGVRSRVVNMGPSMSAWMRSLGFSATGGERGTIRQFKEQVLRIGRCSFSLQWTDLDPSGTETVNVTDTRIVDGMSLWGFTADAGRWSGEIELSERFHAHLKEHAVPLDQRAIAHLSNNSLGLDLYTLFAYRLPRLKQNLTLRWQQLRGQLGAEGSMSSIGERIRETLQEVLAVYPDAKIEVARHGLTMKPSLPSVQKTMVRGSSLRLIV